MQLREGQKKPSGAVIHPRCTWTEKEYWTGLAYAAGVSLSEFIRAHLPKPPKGKK